MMDQRMRNDLDRHITGNYGEDQFRGMEDECSCGHFRSEHVNGEGLCFGTGRQLDAQYGIAPSEVCVCMTFEVE
jgi:hypothetical protein